MTRPARHYGTFQPEEAVKPLELVSPRPGILEVRTVWRNQTTTMVTITDPDVHIDIQWADGWADNPASWRYAITNAALHLYRQGEVRICDG
ncbi:hypothetical protein FB566_0434 [Stackebrandtia endophytica]|uniref:Uncharacterized protein n=1 Tax=Stackebrandtia endophytica TaxID=1496996 RepID=A0A543AQV5_9ACTN|nr:hypothetical protein [Stackebrandtia endophytica]TQL74944.1 hypothetical protein FB566_0434 [Stackebrandtia endophytica]